MFISPRKAKFESGRRLVGGFDFCAFDGGIEVEIDRCAVNDLGNLVTLVIVVKHIAVEGNGAIQQGILGADLKGVNVFWFERQGVNRNARYSPAISIESCSRRIGATGFVTACIGAVDKRLIREI